jgi:hypothetical protein
MRRPAFSSFAFSLILLLSGCGYIGPVQPPSLHIPAAVTTLAAYQVADTLNFSFLLPQQTTDDTTITKFRRIELKIGPDIVPWDYGAWSSAATEVPFTPEQVAAAVGESQALKTSLDISAWKGKNVAIAVRTAQRGENFSQWSNVIHLRVVEALETPVIKPESAAEGVRIVISPHAEHSKVRIFRQGPVDAQPLEIGVAEGTEYIDETAEYGTKYNYRAVTFDDSEKANAVSKETEALAFTPEDKFPPKVPTGVNVLAGAGSVEVSWEPSPDRDVKGYYVFRSVDGGPFERLGDLVNLPNLSDKNVQHGKKYGYQVSALDVRNNESERSAAVEASF